MFFDKEAPLLAAFDFGIKRSILRSLSAAGFRIRVVPSGTNAGEILALKPDGLFHSNGPGDPAGVRGGIETVRSLLGKLPIMGICLGHQILATACGAQTGRLKFGHHGCNHPVKNLLDDTVAITSQNHNFAVVKDSLPRELDLPSESAGVFGSVPSRSGARPPRCREPVPPVPGNVLTAEINRTE